MKKNGNMIAIGNQQELELIIPTAPSIAEEALDKSDCKKILDLIDYEGMHFYQPEGYGSFSGINISYTDETAWIYGRLYDLALEINKESYKFDPLDMVENIWYYEFAKDDSMSWHMDICPGAPFSGRKLTLILNLSTSDDYRGGQLLFNNGEILTAPRSQGTVIAFPGYLVNSVEKVTSGTRKTLVAWFGGTNLK